MIIGVSGRARSGKDSIAQIMIDRFNFSKIAFADSLKEISAKAFEIELLDFHDNSKKDVAFLKPLQVNINHIESLVMLLKGAGCAPSQAQIDALVADGLAMTFVSPRDLLQRVGTDLCRNHLGDSVWIDIFKGKVQKMEGHCIITDVRFLNERQVIKDLNGCNFLILRPSLPAMSLDAHESEHIAMSEEKIDVVIYNDSTVRSLQNDLSLWWQAKVKTL